MTTAELIDCKGLPPGSVLEVETRNRHYQIECLGGSAVRISGHPEYCPTPVNGRMLDAGVIERGKYLQFLLDDRRPVTTSRVVKVRVQRPSGSASIH
jgi:hypothetical protein